MTAPAEPLDARAAPYVGRLHAAATRPDSGTTKVGVIITLDDARALLDLIADLCPEHRECGACGARACEPCSIGDPTAGCPHVAGMWFCEDCRHGMCQHCRADAL